MKKIMVILCITVFSMITGCGKSEELSTLPVVETDAIENNIEMETTKEIVIEVTDEIPEDEIGAVEGFNDMLFEPMDEIVNSTIYDGKIQIADVIVDSTMTVGELMEILSGSELNWEIDYTPEQIILKNDNIWFEAFYMNQRIFTFHALNQTENSISLKDCLVNAIQIDEEIQNNIYFYNGYSVGGLNVPSYIEFKEQLGRDFYGYNGVGNEFTDSNDDILLQYQVLCLDYKFPSLMLYDNSPVSSYTVKFDPKTAECISFRMMTFEMDSYNLKSYDEETEKELDEKIIEQTSLAPLDERLVGTYINERYNFKMCLNADGTAEHDYYGNLLWKYENGRLSIYERTLSVERYEQFHGNVEPGNELNLETNEYAAEGEGNFTKID